MKKAITIPEPQTFRDIMADASVKKLAENLGVTLQSVYKWKRGDTLPGIDIVPDLARELDWPLEKLMAIVVREHGARKLKRGPR